MLPAADEAVVAVGADVGAETATVAVAPLPVFGTDGLEQATANAAINASVMKNRTLLNILVLPKE